MLTLKIHYSLFLLSELNFGRFNCVGNFLGYDQGFSYKCLNNCRISITVKKADQVLDCCAWNKTDIQIKWAISLYSNITCSKVDADLLYDASRKTRLAMPFAIVITSKWPEVAQTNIQTTKSNDPFNQLKKFFSFSALRRLF